LALEADNVSALEKLLSASEAVPALHPAIISAFGWVSARDLQGIAKDLLAAASPFRRAVAVDACVAHGVAAGQPLVVALTDPNPTLRARALRAAGELGQRELMTVCAGAMNDDDPTCRYWAARSTALLGERNRSVGALAEMGTEKTPHATSAFRLAFQAMSLSVSDALLRNLATEPLDIRRVIEGSGIAGNPKYVHWLIKRMGDPATARLAGESFSLITGTDVAAANLDGVPPEATESVSDDDARDEAEAMDNDLPWPDAFKVENWWAANAHRYQAGTRYFMGAPVTHEHCLQVLRNGFQRQRILAAHYLCLLEPGTPLFNTSAPAWRQQRLLARM
jgi:uncharacterized protein (TIGR02270 family)